MKYRLREASTSPANEAASNPAVGYGEIAAAFACCRKITYVKFPLVSSSLGLMAVPSLSACWLCCCCLP